MNCDNGAGAARQTAAGQIRWSFGVALVVAGLVTGGCGQDQIRVYRVAKETPAVAQETAGAGHTHAHEGAPAGMPKLTWVLPEGWKELPAESMRVANFALEGKEGQRAEASVIPMAGMSAGDSDLVNMWRRQLGLAAASPQEIASRTESVPIGTDQGKLFEIFSDKPVAESTGPVGLLVAVLEKDGVSWFFKIVGDAAFVREQKPSFTQFLKSVGFQAGAGELALASRPHPVSTNSKEVPRDNSSRPTWVVPQGWQEAPAGQMLVAKFIVPGAGGARAELNVSQLGGTGGGILPNINRWRNQLGLPPLSEADLANQTQSLDVGNRKAMVVDMQGTEARTGEKARLVAAIVPQTGQTWFYKLMGNEKVVEREKDTFMKFVQTARYSE